MEYKHVVSFFPQAYPLQVVMFGDMGKTKGSPTLPHLYKEAQDRENTALIHVGDFAYDLSSDGGQVQCKARVCALPTSLTFIFRLLL